MGQKRAYKSDTVGRNEDVLFCLASLISSLLLV